MKHLLVKLTAVANLLDQRGEYVLANRLDKIIKQAFDFGEDYRVDERNDVPSSQVPQSDPQPENQLMPESFENSVNQEQGRGLEPEAPTNILQEVTEMLQVLQEAGYSNEQLTQLINYI